VCLVGFGYWGPNLARNIASSEYFEISFVIESDMSKHIKISALYPNVTILSDLETVSSLENLVDVCVIATPTSSHYRIAMQFLEINCHIWIEKPFTRSIKEAKDLLQLAQDKGLRIFIDHTYLYSPAVEVIGSCMSEVGDITYIKSTRANFGIIQNDSSVIWDLAVHDLSIVQYLTGLEPLSVIAIATSPFPGIQDSVATMILEYGTFVCTIDVNWLSPFKVRDFILGGTSKSIYFDDTKTEDKIKIYSQSIEDLPSVGNANVRQYDYKYGDILIPDVPNDEALERAFNEFSLYIHKGIEPPSSGEKALNIISILTAAQESINRNSEKIKIKYNEEEIL
jgi:predicted dehydrogenase